jgi:hypothetical protein
LQFPGQLRSGHYLWRGWHRIEICFLVKNLADPTIKNSKSFLANQYCTRIPGQKLYKRIPFICHMLLLLLWHEFDNCLWNYVVNYFLWRHHLPPDKSENDQNSDSDLHIVLTYDCWHCVLVFNIWVSQALEMTIHFFTQPFALFCFSFIPNLLLTRNFVYPTLFSSVPSHK